MAFRREKTSDLYLKETSVENMFINEYMATAPGDYVKVYLMAQMYADAAMDISNEAIAKALNLDQEDVLKAWTYWEKEGVIRKVLQDPQDRLSYDVEFMSLREQLYGSKASAPAPILSSQLSMADKEIQNLLNSIEQVTGTVMNGTEVTEILAWINDYSISPEVILYGYEYSAKRKKKNIKYVEAVIRNWVDEGLTDLESIEKRLSEEDKKQYLYKRIFQALGFNRNATEEERRIMNTWFEDMGFSIDKVLEACKKTSGIASPNINYVNKVLSNWHDEETGQVPVGKQGDITTAEISRYYELLREQNEKDADQRRREVCDKVPRIKEIENELTRLATEMTKIIISDRVDKQQAIEKIKEETDSLNIEEAFLLTDNGFELDHMEVKYACDKCKDTGVLETGERCPCFGQVTKEKINLITKVK